MMSEALNDESPNPPGLANTSFYLNVKPDEKDIQPSLYNDIHTFGIDPHLAFMQNTIATNKINQIGINRSLLNSVDNMFSHKIDNWKVTNQKSSGRCWIFAGLNIFKQYGLKTTGQDFEFSQNYVAFWDKLERANYFLEAIIDTIDLHITDETVRFLLETPISDGGQWDMFVNILKKYGVVPKSAMPETESSSSTQLLNANINAKLRECAKVLRNLSSQASLDKLREKKCELLKSIQVYLSIHLGTPPKEFVWRYETKKGLVNQKTTPLEFAQEYINFEELDNYVCLVNDPRTSSPMGRTFTVKYLGNLPDRPVIYLNVDSKTMREVTKNMILDEKVVWFGCDVRKCFEGDRGVWDTKIFNYKYIYGTDIEMSKEDRLLYGQSKMSHAMVFTGLDLKDEGDSETVLKWRVENSWGDRKGVKGFYVMNGNEWFDEYVFEIAAHKKFLSEELLNALKEKPIELPPWDPMGALAID